ncbi:cuticle protein AMP1A-like [Homarus americanus]|uniref:cuticle protein AMP1A-like n=1 Tax=Homarus americanus TaxID=6706 RepID=UPI001C48878B|nr:cuticle protein AMP1A-like [Homarus americanus]
MKFVLLAAMAAVAVAVPRPDYKAADSMEKKDVVPIIQDDRVHEEDGRYHIEVKTGNGITISQSGSPEGDSGAISKAGEYSYTAPDGTIVRMKFVANANGFQPESDLLPVAPEFPHPIPQFVLDQIAFAAAEDAARARAEASAPSSKYSSPN